MRTVIETKNKPDYVIIICLAALVIFGLIMITSSSSYLGKARFGDSFYYLKHQILYGLTIGLIGFFLAGYISYRRYKKIAAALLLINIGLLFLVFTPLGVSSGGAERWLKIGPLTFQPSELLKLTFILYLAAWLSGNKERQSNFIKSLVPFFIITAIISALLLKQPSTSTVFILISAALVVYFASGAKISYLAGFAIVGSLALLLVIYFTPYRLNRILNFLQPEANPQTGGYHLNQALIAIGSGGWLGVGYGRSTTKINYLPEPIGDSIFAVIGEEFGFVGSLILISIFLILIIKTLALAKKINDKFGKLVLIGFASLIAIQTFINIAAISGLIPLTGTPLPFISYGGTALAVFMTMGGIIINISKHA